MPTEPMPAEEPGRRPDATPDSRSDPVAGSCSQQDEVQWRALQYVLGELSDDAAEQFELELADSPLARDCLIRVTHLIECVTEQPTAHLTAQRTEQPAIARNHGTHSPVRKPQSAAGWAIGLGAACLILTALVCSLSSPLALPSSPSSASVKAVQPTVPHTRVLADDSEHADDSEQVALIVDIWTRSSSAQSTTDTESDPLDSLDEPFAEMESLTESADVSASSFVDVPGWMLAAVAGSPEGGAAETIPTVEWETN